MEAKPCPDHTPAKCLENVNTCYTCAMWALVYNLVKWGDVEWFYRTS
jgi:hypothetical protein